jgi:hypothetical protein
MFTLASNESEIKLQKCYPEEFDDFGIIYSCSYKKCKRKK